jgi:hypothetical protein
MEIREIQTFISNEEKLKIQELEKFERKRVKDSIRKQVTERREIPKLKKKKQKKKHKSQEIESFGD